jgi:hypothetical protein
MCGMIETIEMTRRPAPAVTPQALGWDGEHVWVSSRDLGKVYQIDAATWRILQEIDPPGVVWAARYDPPKA